MADSPSPADNPANQSTRQLLDELDALMQRMLALPVQQQDETPPDPAPPSPSPVPAPVASRTLTVQAPVPSAPATQEVVVTRAPTLWTKPPPTPPAAPPRREDPFADLSAPAYLPLGAEPLLPLILQRPKQPALDPKAPTPPRPASSAPAPRPAPVQAPPPAPQPRSWTPRWVRSLNRRYDRATDWLGPLGRWLRSDRGRNLLGWSGILMLGAAVLIALVRFLG